MNMKLIASMLAIAVMSASAHEHVISVGPGMSHMNWKSSSDVSPSGQWSSGRYQLAAQVGWYMMVTPMVFTGMNALWAHQSKVTIHDEQLSVSANDFSAISGLRYQYSRYETRLWWGINYRDVTSSQVEVMPKTQYWGPTWGVSYGSQSDESRLSWHWGVMITPGYYNYVSAPSIQVPTRTTTYMSMEWKIV